MLSLCFCAGEETGGSNKGRAEYTSRREPPAETDKRSGEIERTKFEHRRLEPEKEIERDLECEKRVEGS